MISDTQAVHSLDAVANRHKAMLPAPCVMVIFGGAGDLSWRKLLPAIYNLNVDGVLPAHFAVVGFGLRPFCGQLREPLCYPVERVGEA